jgi:hypothetical protein
MRHVTLALCALLSLSSLSAFGPADVWATMPDEQRTAYLEGIVDGITVSAPRGSAPRTTLDRFTTEYRSMTRWAWRISAVYKLERFALASLKDAALITIPGGPLIDKATIDHEIVLAADVLKALDLAKIDNQD